MPSTNAAVLNSQSAGTQPESLAVQRSSIHVLMVGPTLDFVGGQAVQASRLLSALDQLPELTLTFFPIGPRPPKILAWAGEIPIFRTLVSFVLYTWRLAFETRKYDVLHIFTAGLSSYTLWTIPALFFGRLFRKKLIINYRDGQAEQHITEWRTAKPTLLLADRVITPSGFLVDIFSKYGICAQSIFNVIDVGRFRYRKRRKLRPIFMTNRMLEPLYNVECVLRAFSIIQGKYPEASLTVAHDGCCRPALEKLAQELKLRNTCFIGKVLQDKVPDLYDSADIYLMSPNIDNMPGTLLECFASGLPAVTTAAGGIPYIARDGESALLVAVNDHQALAARAIELLEDENLVEHLTQHGLHEAEKYHWKPVRDQWAALYKELLREAAGSR
ncbi:MAG: glycosyltransferase family 4 protein [Acidobacteriaceae bacterium]|nr:glycosyltransferase family 4 protein [Acidobacteriaceae bacterium]